MNWDLNGEEPIMSLASFQYSCVLEGDSYMDLVPYHGIWAKFISCVRLNEQANLCQLLMAFREKYHVLVSWNKNPSRTFLFLTVVIYSFIKLCIHFYSTLLFIWIWCRHRKSQQILLTPFNSKIDFYATCFDIIWFSLMHIYL